MPARNLFKRIAEKTSKRVLQMDNANLAACNPDAQPAKGRVEAGRCYAKDHQHVHRS